MGDITLLGMEFSGGMAMATMFLAIIAIGANCKLFMKCEQPIWAAVIPGYNVVIAMRILGRPDAHALLFLVPVLNVFFFLKTVIELAQAFGKRSMTDFVLAAVFNVFYVLNLSLAYQEEYEGPVYGKSAHRTSELQAA
ncbi:MAG TPA: hypothetical protein DD635_02485 [Flavobacteriales bacterium]|nr:hypothetical protein [Flavobacteriales bacterium]